MVRQFCNVTNRGNLLALFKRFCKVNAVLVVDADGTEALLVTMQFLVMQRAEAGESKHVLLLLHQVHHLYVLADYLGLEAMMVPSHDVINIAGPSLVAGLPVCIEFLQICLVECNCPTAAKLIKNSDVRKFDNNYLCEKERKKAIYPKSAEVFLMRNIGT